MRTIKPDVLNNNRPIAIVGDTDSGKTNLAFHLMSMIQDRPVYLLGYPKEVRGTILLSSVEDLRLISDCVLFIDEFDLYFPVGDKKSNRKLIELMKFAQHWRIKLIISTQLSQFITKQVQALIPCWAMTQLDLMSVKNGSIISHALKHRIKHFNINSDFVKIPLGEYVWYNKKAIAGENGFYAFPDMDIGKDWTNKTSDKNTAKNCAINTPENISKPKKMSVERVVEAVKEVLEVKAYE